MENKHMIEGVNAGDNISDFDQHQSSPNVISYCLIGRISHSIKVTLLLH